MASAYNDLGLALQKSQDNTGATTQFKKALEIDPKMTEANINLGNSYLAGKNFKDAAAAYTQAISNKPDDFLAHYNLGLTFSAQNETEKAIEEYKTVLRLSPQYAVAHYALALAYLDQNRSKDAQAEFETYLGSEPNGTYSGLARTNLDKIKESLATVSQSVQATADDIKPHAPDNASNNVRMPLPEGNEAKTQAPDDPTTQTTQIPNDIKTETPTLDRPVDGLAPETRD